LWQSIHVLRAKQWKVLTRKNPFPNFPWKAVPMNPDAAVFISLT
jgi:hypothetical protein